jgi:sulfofructose kinase
MRAGRTMMAMTALDVLCIGHASYDITMRVPHHPGANEKMHAEALRYDGGGPAANAAVAVRRLGGTSAYCGYLGWDMYGDANAKAFVHEGVDLRWTVRGEQPTPVSAILAKPDGTRCVINYKRETPWLQPEVLAAMPQMAAGVLLFDGHEPLISVDIARAARRRGIPTVIDAGSVHRGTRELVPIIDYLVSSERFALDWAQTTDAYAALARLAEVAPNVVITRGGEGLLWARQGERGQVPAFAVDIVDSTGAGDAFHGAFAFGLARGMGWIELLRYASAVGALTCTQLGARAGIPDADAVRTFLDRG